MNFNSIIGMGSIGLSMIILLISHTKSHIYQVNKTSKKLTQSIVLIRKNLILKKNIKYQKFQEV